MMTMVSRGYGANAFDLSCGDCHGQMETMLAGEKKRVRSKPISLLSRARSAELRIDSI